VQRFLYTDETEAFLYFFPNELHEWLSKLVDSHGTWRFDVPIVWTPELVRFLEASRSNITWVIDHWIHYTLEAF